MDKLPIASKHLAWTFTPKVTTQTIPSSIGAELTDEVGLEIFDQLKDSQGRFRTLSLFREHEDKSYPAHFTLKKYDWEKGGKTYISLWRKYMEIGDPTEYKVAIRLLGSWDHWQKLVRTQWFMEHLQGWRDELAVKIESDRYWEAYDAAQNGSLTGTKFLAERYGEKEKTKRGRPSKAEKARHLRAVKQDEKDLAEDAKRVGVA